MSRPDIPIHLDMAQTFPKAAGGPIKPVKAEVATRKRLNSQSQVVQMPMAGVRTTLAAKERPQKRNQVEYYVTLSSLNDTFVKKHLHVPYYPETTKLGRPAGTKIKPDVANGYFDLRVLSRNHAAMFIDPASGQLMIHDLGSSNGTYVNEEKITDDPVAIKIGDVINLGFNIQVETNHKQISAQVENINIMSNHMKHAPNTGDIVLSMKGLKKDDFPSIDTPEFKHYDFVQHLLTRINDDKSDKKKPLSFDSALFSDINPNMEESLLGLLNKGSIGIFNNAQITNPGTLEATINCLSASLSKAKQQSNTLKTLENFVTNYQSRLNTLNTKYLHTEKEKAAKSIEDEYRTEIIALKRTKTEYKLFKSDTSTKLLALEKQIEDLQNERNSFKEEVSYYKEQLNQKSTELLTLNADRVEYDKAIELLANKSTYNGTEHGEKPVVARHGANSNTNDSNDFNEGRFRSLKPLQAHDNDENADAKLEDPGSGVAAAPDINGFNGKAHAISVSEDSAEMAEPKSAASESNSILKNGFTSFPSMDLSDDSLHFTTETALPDTSVSNEAVPLQGLFSTRSHQLQEQKEVLQSDITPPSSDDENDVKDDLSAKSHYDDEHNVVGTSTEVQDSTDEENPGPKQEKGNEQVRRSVLFVETEDLVKHKNLFLLVCFYVVVGGFVFQKVFGQEI